MHSTTTRAAILLAAGAISTHANAQLRIASWNITNYAGGRDAAIETSVYATFNSQQMAPDILAMQEMIGAASLTNLVNILNGAPGSPGDWTAAPYVESADTERAFLYRTSKVVHTGTTVVANGNGSTNPRHIMRYDFRPVGYSGIVSVYNLHMKAGSSGTDQARRLAEAQLVRTDAESLSATRPFIVAGDLNIQSSSQAAYVELFGNQADNSGRVFDPILTSGNWNNSSSFRFVHTQDPEGGGGMDDRFDQILISEEIFDGAGFEYDGAALTRYSTTTWNDPNHSYRAWGNDGSSFNQSLRVNGNAFVGPTIAQALIDSCGGASGHIPVYADFLVPAVISLDAPVYDAGTLTPGQLGQISVTVTNTADTALWTAGGISDLNYSFNPLSPNLSAPAGSFTESAGGDGVTHTIDINAPMAEGGFGFPLQILNDSEGLGVDSGVETVFVVGTVVAAPSCPADVTTINTNPGDAGYGQPDGAVDGADLSYFVEFWLAGDPSVADVTTLNTNPGDPAYGLPDGAVDGADLSYFVEQWLAGCP